MKRVLSSIAFAVVASASAAATAQIVDHAARAASTASVNSAGPATEGEVRKVDRDAKKLTIRHGPIQNLEMPAMTMVFQVADAGMLDQVKAGDKVRFAADKVGGAFIVTQVEQAK